MSAPTNPQVSPELTLLLPAHECLDRLYDFYFDISEYGVELVDAAPTGTKISLGLMGLSQANVLMLEDAAQRVRDAEVREANRENRIWTKAMDKREVFA